MRKTKDSSKDGRQSRSQRKRKTILEAATDLFLRNGYLGTSMDEVAQRADVSKQTVYAQFASKEALFVAMVGAMTSAAASEVHSALGVARDGEDVAGYLRAYAERQLLVVLTPRLMQLRRLVIGEVGTLPAARPSGLRGRTQARHQRHSVRAQEVGRSRPARDR